MGSKATADITPIEDPAAGDLPVDDEPETGPLRRCAVTRERLGKELMVRFVVAPDATVVPDLAERLPGRGIWLSARGDVLETARVRGAFARAARQPVKVPPALVADVAAALSARIQETLGLARRAGLAVAGFAKAREWLAEGKTALVVQASDGSPGERSRLLGAQAGRVAVITPLDAASLGRVFGRDHAVHVAVMPGRLAERLIAEAARLAGIAGKVGGLGQAGHAGCPDDTGRTGVTSEADAVGATIDFPTGPAGRARSPGAPVGQDNAGG